MNLKKTLLIIKPDGMNFQKEIISMIKGSLPDLLIEQSGIFQLSKEIVTQHYYFLKEKDFFEEILTYMTSSPVYICVLSGEEAVTRLRKLVGSTNPAEAEEGTIRKIYGTSISSNAVHASSDDLAAQEEILRFFDSYSPAS